MLNLGAKTKIVQSQGFPVATGYTVSAEGLAMIQTFESGVEKVLPSLGGAAEIFVGFSYGEVFTPATKSLQEVLTCPAAGTFSVTLLHAPIGGTQVNAWDVTSGAQLTIGNPANALEYSVTTATLLFNVARAGHSIRITYRYNPTAAELIAVDNVRITSFSSSEYLGSIGVITQGEIYTDMFDASKNWNAATGVKTQANGLLDTQAGGGTTISCVITHVPDTNYPYLGIRF